MYGDFRMQEVLLWFQVEFSKFLCFLCLSDSRAGTVNYDRVEWPPRKILTPGKHNMIRSALLVKRSYCLHFT